jgi:hypothetical protein
MLAEGGPPIGRVAWPGCRPHQLIGDVEGDVLIQHPGARSVPPSDRPLRRRRLQMLMCESPAAVHHELPVKVVVYNNFAFGLITLEPESAGLAPFRRRIELPNPDLRRLRGLAAAVAFWAHQARRVARRAQRCARGRWTGDRRRGRGGGRDAQPSACEPGRALYCGQGQGSGAGGDRVVTASRPSGTARLRGQR